MVEKSNDGCLIEIDYFCRPSNGNVCYISISSTEKIQNTINMILAVLPYNSSNHNNISNLRIVFVTSNYLHIQI